MTENLEKKINVSEDGFDLCISCGTKTKYKTETNVDVRVGYIDGAGQLCDTCYEPLIGVKK